MFEQTFKNIDDILYKDAGADSELDYIEQTSWVLFLRYLDHLESEKADEAALEGKAYEPILDDEYRWPNWAMPKTADGKLDHHKTMTGPDLVKFVDHKLFPYLADFKQKSIDNPKSIEYKIGEIFSELSNKVKSGYNLREIIEMTDELPFGSSKDKHELSHLYETKIKNMGNAGRNGGQYYTPRPLIRAMIKVIDPKIGEKIYDAACGSAGFLCEAYEYIYNRMEKTTANLKTLQEKTLYGKEKKNLAYIIGVMNMILHGIEAPNIIHTNTLTENIRDIQEKDRYNVILANPPFGGKERKEVQQNFDIKTGETASLFLQHFIKSLKAGGRAAIVIKNTFLSNADNASVSLRKHLLESCNLHTILDMPAGTFLGAGVKTVVLFFTKGEPTEKIWYYQCVPGRSLGKTSPLNDDDMIEFKQLQKTFADSENSWTIDISSINTSNYDLTVNNPNSEIVQFSPSLEEIITEMEAMDDDINEILRSVKGLFINETNRLFAKSDRDWIQKELKDISQINYGYTEKASTEEIGPKFLRITDIQDNSVDWLTVPYCKCTESDIKKYKLESGDIVFARTGATTGKSYFIENPPIAVFASYLIRLKVLSKEEILPKLVYYFFQSGLYWQEINKGISGAAQGGFNASKLGKMSISFPKSIAEQQSIIDKLDAIDHKINLLRKFYLSKIEMVEQAKLSSYNEAFENELIEAE